MPPPPSNPEDKSSRPPSAAGDAGIRIAGAASRAASISAAPSPSPRSAAGKDGKPPVKLNRERHVPHGHGPGDFASRLGPPVQRPQVPQQRSSSSSGGLARTNASNDASRGSQRPQPPQHRSSSSITAQATASAPASAPADDDEEEEGAIDDSAQPAQQSGGSELGFKPPPPKTPPHPSSASNSRRPSAGNDRDRRSDLHHSQSYQPRSPSLPKSHSAAASTSAAYYPRSPSPSGGARRSIREYDSHAYQAQDSRYARNEHDNFRRSGGGNANSMSRLNHTREHERHSGSARGRDRAEDIHDPTRGRDNDWRADRDRGWNRESRADRNQTWDHSRHTDHRDRNGRERELSPPPTSRSEQRNAGWALTPPQIRSSSQSADPAAATNGNADPAYAQQRPPSRIGRAEPPPPLSRPDLPGGEQGVKRPRSPSAKRSPPAGLLKRKPNFPAVVPPTLLSPGKQQPIESKDNVAPGAPLPPKLESMQSPVLPSRTGSEWPASQPGSALATGLSGSAAAAAAAQAAQQAAASSSDTNYQLVCQTLDDPDCPSVRLSCLPRKPSSSSSTPAMSGRERRKSRPAPVLLNQREFLGCSSLDDYEISIKLGQGTFGEVLKGRQILTGTQVALKKVTIHDAKDGLPITALREIKLLKKLKHPSIVPVIDMAYRPSGERGKLGDVYMVEPYMDHDLNGMLENPSIRLEHSQIKLYMKQLLEGTLYLHKNRILHRDMKAANLLINNAGQLQIADFGLARPYRDPGQSWTGKGWPGGTHRYTNMVVTRWYRPPELLAGEKKYGPPIDMWGIGCILAEMVMGKPLFKGTSEINQLQLIAELCGSPNETSFPGWSALPGVKDADPSGRPDPHPEVAGQHDFGNYPRKVKEMFRNVYDAGPGCADLIDKLLMLDPKKRLTAQGALEHEWFWTKPWPADKNSLPKYEHSKEIDRVKREWKPQPAAVPAQVPVGGGMGGRVAQQPGGGMGMGMQARPPTYSSQAAQQQQRPGMAVAAPPYAGGGGRHAYPNQNHHQQGARFPHPNQQRWQHNLPARPGNGARGPSGGGGGGGANPYSF